MLSLHYGWGLPKFDARNSRPLHRRRSIREPHLRTCEPRNLTRAWKPPVVGLAAVRPLDPHRLPRIRGDRRRRRRARGAGSSVDRDLATDYRWLAIVIIAVIGAGFQGTVLGRWQWGILHERLPGLVRRAWVKATVVPALLVWLFAIVPQAVDTLSDGGDTVGRSRTGSSRRSFSARSSGCRRPPRCATTRVDGSGGSQRT